MTEHELRSKICKMYNMPKDELNRAVAYYLDGSSSLLHAWTGYNNRVLFSNDFPELREYLCIVGNKPEFKHIKNDLERLLR